MEKGYTLVELIIVILLLSLLVLGLGRLFAEAIRLNQDLHWHQQALSQAKSKIENLRLLSYSEIEALQNPPQTNTQIGPESLPNLPQGELFTSINNFLDPTYSIKEVKVEVRWHNSKNQVENINLTTLIGQRGLND